jgi:molybdopterin-synthase adenylyltransferase
VLKPSIEQADLDRSNARATHGRFYCAPTLHRGPMNDQQLLRYSRHIFLDELGISGQERLLNAHALLIGVGGLGSAAALYLVTAGVGKITLVDDDCVDLTNLQRQVVHTVVAIGQPKVASAAHTLHALNPEVEVHAVQARADASLLAIHVPMADVVIDCSDNHTTRHLVNAACVQYAKPLVSGAAIGFDGQVSVYDTRHHTHPCYACVFPAEAVPEEAHCATMGVFAPLVGMIGSMQAAEALKLLASLGTPLVNRLQMLNARSMEWTTITTSRTPGCSVCSSPFHRRSNTSPL